MPLPPLLSCCSSRQPTADGFCRYVKRTKRTPKLKIIQKWSKQILEGLDYLHSHSPPIIHRDLKCDNIFINGNQGDVKLGDFGLSTLQAETTAQSIIGTPEFMAPEMYNESYTAKVDIYAFGMCLLEIATGKHPFSECQNAAQIFKKVTAGGKPDGIKDVEEVVVQQVIVECLADQEERPTAVLLLTHPFLTQEAPAPQPALAPGPAPAPAPGIPMTPRLLEPEPEPEPEQESVAPPAVAPAKANEPVQSMTVDANLSAGGIIAISMKIHVRGLLTKVDFRFDVAADNADTVANEMAGDLQITKEQHMQVVEFIEDAVQRHKSGMMPCVKTVVQSGSREPFTDAPVSDQIPPTNPVATSGGPVSSSEQVSPTRRASAPNISVDGVLAGGGNPIRQSPSTQSNQSNQSYNSNSSLSPTNVSMDAELSGYERSAQLPGQPRSSVDSPVSTYSDAGTVGSEKSGSRADSATDLLDFLDAEPATAEQLEQVKKSDSGGSMNRPTPTQAMEPVLAQHDASVPAPGIDSSLDLQDRSMEPAPGAGGALDRSLEPAPGIDGSLEPPSAPSALPPVSESLAAVPSGSVGLTPSVLVTSVEPAAAAPQLACVVSESGSVSSSAPLDLMDFIDAKDMPPAPTDPVPRMSPTPTDTATSEPPRDIAPLVTLSVGTTVLVVGLVNAAKHNRKTAVILSYDPVKIRYIVEVSTQEQISVRPANVQLPEVKRDPFENLSFTSSKSKTVSKAVSMGEMKPEAAVPSSPMRGSAPVGAGGAPGAPPLSPPAMSSSTSRDLLASASAAPMASPAAPGAAASTGAGGAPVTLVASSQSTSLASDPIGIPSNQVAKSVSDQGPMSDSTGIGYGSPDKTQIEELIKSAKKEDILRMQKLLNATVASMDDSLEPQDGACGNGHGGSGGGSGGGSAGGEGNGGSIALPPVNPDAPLEKWVVEHVDTKNPEDAHETADVVTTLLDAKLRAISRTGLDTMGRTPPSPATKAPADVAAATGGSGGGGGSAAGGGGAAPK